MIECWMACWRHYEGDCFFAPEPTHCRDFDLYLSRRLLVFVVSMEDVVEAQCDRRLWRTAIEGCGGLRELEMMYNR